MNEAHMVSKMKNRLARLRRRVKDAPADRQGSMTSRIKEIESLLPVEKKK